MPEIFIIMAPQELSLYEPKLQLKDVRRKLLSTTVLMILRQKNLPSKDCTAISFDEAAKFKFNNEL